MYNYKKFGYVIVEIDKNDDLLETLIEDLLNWEYRLGQVEEKDKICFKGLLPMKGIEHLRLLKDVSPYGRGYEITVDGFDIYEANRRFNKLCREAR